ncbi:energy-coupling factor ABC transporter permease [Eubacterium sp. MSJ-13]|uniref:energy-coupling factor ABC transporter permease n=1 Tax=Eubacterium sp. MSJ-13 TaxID=2841513 RepID=UPI001C116B3C|nr:energy-coupling factor ABC transporter permease [Eubacterium sp. MSJ-13]MBU5477804.1 energy-coupling factor ABC transporter permease [Eubacterium sp. MSJ-13]
MHMADALVSAGVAGTMYALSAGVASYSVKNIHLENDSKKIPVMGVMGAFVFAAQMINFTIPGTGSSGHLCGGMLLTALLGPYAAFLTLIGVLLIQCLFFADGGLLAFGCNVWNMAFYGCFIGWFLIWKPFKKSGLSKTKIIAASVLGSVISLQFGALSVSLETKLSGITELPFIVFVKTMQPIHLAIGLIEGLITAAVLIFIYEARPEMLEETGNNSTAKHTTNKISFKKTLFLLFIISLITGGIISLFASSHPDGLEWSIQKLTGSTDVAGKSDKIHSFFSSIQDVLSFLPDYTFKNSNAANGTSFSGITGSIIVLLLCTALCLIIKSIKKRKNK